MRIPIREQLALLVLVCCLTALAVLAIATWFQNYHFVVDIRLSNLALTASLKAAQMAANLLLYQTTVQAMSTRVLIQSALQRYHNVGNNTEANWARSQTDLSSALATNSGPNAVFLQAIIFPRDETGVGGRYGLLNVTSEAIIGTMKLPYANPDGSPVRLGDDGLGYPPDLYPNLTYHSTVVNSTYNASHAFFQGYEIVAEQPLVIGPMAINSTTSLMSLTVSINNNTSRSDILGYLSVILDTGMLYSTVNSPEGLDNTGEILVVGPDTSTGKFPLNRSAVESSRVLTENAKFVLPPQNNVTLRERHSERAFGVGDPALPFTVSEFPAVADAWTKNNHAINNAGALLSTSNEQNEHISAGYARLNTEMVDWVLIFEQSHGEVYAPVVKLRKIVLGCVFGTIGVIMILVFPIAHFSVRPIRQLRAATKKTVEPYIPEHASYTSSSSETSEGLGASNVRNRRRPVQKASFLALMSRFRRKKDRVPDSSNANSLAHRRTFRIPGKVPESKHIIKDELSDLTQTFNEMSDELVMQYERLEERVKERTAELEQSKKAAEAANESKTLFIANISHELKTPLNGILGMCAVSMQDTDLKRIRQSLGVIYKSGDLLLHLLTDLLTFSKNSIGQQLSLDEKEFRLGDVSSQLLSIFDKQAKDNQISLMLRFMGTNDAFGKVSEKPEENIYGPFGTGRVKDMCLWGDKNRILQVLINLTSNSLKFTPASGSVEIRVRCTGLEIEEGPKTGSRKGSLQSKQSKTSKRRGRGSDRSLSGSIEKASTGESAQKTQDPNSTLSIKVDGETKHIPQVAVRQRSQSPPPLNTKQLAFEFEVEDTGPGIPESQQQRVFEPFVQGDLGLSKRYGGTGLGLSICAQLAALMGGSISLKSNVNVGSTFCMRIPLRWVKERADSTTSSNFRLSSKANSIVGQSLYDEPRTPRPNGSISDVSVHSTHSLHGDAAFNSNTIDDQQPRLVGFSQPYFANPVQSESPNPRKADLKRAEEEAVKAGRKVKVLVAEDNKVNQQVVLRMLKLEEIYDVTVAKDGQEAFDLVRESMNKDARFDLVFMDIQMPNLDGIQSTKRIREMGFSAPIVALTAFSEESNMRECLSSGMDDFMPKPIRRPQLKAVIKKYCATIPEEEDADKSSMSVPRVRQSQLNLAQINASGENLNLENGRPPGGSVDSGVAGGQEAETEDFTNKPILETRSIERTDGDSVSPLS